MSVIESAVLWAIGIAEDDSHGYSQANRWGPDYDCSSLVISAFKQAGVPLKCTYTGDMLSNMLGNGFKLVDLESRQRGDVLLYHYSGSNGHTAIYIGDGQIVHARSSEGNSVQGDGNGREIVVAAYYNGGWQYCLRYCGEETGIDNPSVCLSADTSLCTREAEESGIDGIPEVSLGDTGSVVRSMQLLLIGNGFTCGSCGADGEFGQGTLAGVRNYQTERELEVDGICGPVTWGSLILKG